MNQRIEITHLFGNIPPAAIAARHASYPHKPA